MSLDGGTTSRRIVLADSVGAGAGSAVGTGSAAEDWPGEDAGRSLRAAGSGAGEMEDWVGFRLAAGGGGVRRVRRCTMGGAIRGASGEGAAGTGTSLRDTGSGAIEASGAGATTAGCGWFAWGRTGCVVTGISWMAERRRIGAEPAASREFAPLGMPSADSMAASGGAFCEYWFDSCSAMTLRVSAIRASHSGEPNRSGASGCSAGSAGSAGSASREMRGEFAGGRLPAEAGGAATSVEAR